MVGTRAPTQYGKHVAMQLAEQCAERGICIVSGLARGIDSMAHRGALNQVGKTIAVLGNDLMTVYPAENKSLFRQIEAEGLLVSEVPLGAPNAPWLVSAAKPHYSWA